jgi:hypothetical protein
LRDLKVEVWATIRYLAEVIETSTGTTEVRLRAASAMATNAGALSG